VALGGGRHSPGARIDPRVGLSQLLALGSGVAAGQALARVHAADAGAAAAAVAAVQAALRIEDTAPASSPAVVEILASLP